MNPSSPVKPPARIKKSYVTLLVIAALLWGSSVQTGTSLTKLFQNFPEMFKILAEMLPPDWGYIDVIWSPMMETVRMAILGTTVGALLAIPVALMAAGNVTRTVWVQYPARFLLNLIRTIPELLFAALFVTIFGIGSIAGIVALIFFSFGIVSKLFYESIEAIDPGPLEAMTAVGANKLQWIRYAVIPQVTAHFMSYFLYTFEVNIRASAVLGMVGAGGIGILLDRTLNQLRYDRVAMIILLTFAIVVAVDYASNKIRERLL